MTGSKLICGLGNPGPRYAKTRHNVGYQVVDRIARTLGGSWSKYRDQARLSAVEIEGNSVLLVQPLTYMNLSGLAVRSLVRKRGIDPVSLLVINDDLDLPFGALRLRPGGSAGGHRGVQSIIDHLGACDFPRLRIGIGRPTLSGEVTDYVLSPFPWADREQLADILEQAAAAACLWVTEGIEAAMNRYNRNV